MAKQKETKSNGWIILLVIMGILILGIIVLSVWQIPYTVSGTSNQQVSTSGCDKVSGCTCLHKSWFGLGACNSCNCITQTETIKYCSALSKIFGSCGQ